MSHWGPGKSTLQPCPGFPLPLRPIQPTQLGTHGPFLCHWPPCDTVPRGPTETTSPPQPAPPGRRPRDWLPSKGTIVLSLAAGPPRAHAHVCIHTYIHAYTRHTLQLRFINIKGGTLQSPSAPPREHLVPEAQRQSDFGKEHVPCKQTRGRLEKTTPQHAGLQERVPRGLHRHVHS